MGKRSNDGCRNKRFGNDYSHGKEKWEVERATLEGRTEGVDVMASLQIKRKRGRETVLDAEAKEWLCGTSALDVQFKE